MDKKSLFQVVEQSKYKINQGAFKNNFYFGKTVIIDNQKTDAIILSNKDVLVDLSQIKIDSKPKGSSELKEKGFTYVDSLLEICPTWSNSGITEFLEGKKVEGEELFNLIREKLDYYIDVQDKRFLDFVTVYDISTYCYSLFNSIGYLFLYSEKESGKTKLMNLIELICFNPINATNPSESSLFRITNSLQPTLLIDDFENLEKEKQAVLNQLLKVGYKRSGQTIRNEKVGQSFVPKKFDVYCPKVITNTTGLDSITVSRCIVLRMLRTKTTKGSREPNENDQTWQEIRDSCYNFVLNNWKKISESYLDCEIKDFKNRQLELVRGPLAVAKTINEKLYADLVPFLKECFEDRDLEDISTNWEYILFSSLFENISEKRFYSVGELSELCVGKIGIEKEASLRRWIGKTISKIPLFKKRRVGSGVEYLLSQELVQEYMERTGYPIENTLTTLTTLSNGDKIKELDQPILDSCFHCKERQFVKYSVVGYPGKNYCDKCAEELKGLHNYV
ncbi:MAG: hypothetical protein HON47_02655 [Candidatus Diapherotrites archaeon]|uniref:DUF3631 domain-containing protein n=1 Tax=Candidatus Iainarchaeum sp. TaxID=3101447 RepID=A0A8T5GFE2_9ARCH|nr:hypothetical protein [Candidatus Diapherotrites archaeon]MBT7241548.1 hypothetical protein [Candidatus Diapherotrites archaeon]